MSPPFIAGEISQETGEVMISAADVVSWLRRCSEASTNVGAAAYIEVMADMLAGYWIDVAADVMDRGGA